MRHDVTYDVAMKCLIDLTIAGIKLEDCPDLLRDAVTSKLEGFVGETKPIPQVKEEGAVKTGVDLEWLKESLETLQWTDCGKYLQEKYKVTGTRISKQVTQLSPPQLEEFVEEIIYRLTNK